MVKKLQRFAVVGIAGGAMALGVPTMALASTASAPAEHSVVAAHSVSLNDGWRHHRGFDGRFGFGRFDGGFGRFGRFDHGFGRFGFDNGVFFRRSAVFVGSGGVFSSSVFSGVR